MADSVCKLESSIKYTIALSSRKIMWTVNIESDFIQLIIERRNIWDIKDALYTKKNLRKKSFEEIGEALSTAWPEEKLLFTPDSLMKKFKNMRTYFKKEKNKILTAPSGSAGVAFSSRWVHFNRMSFLDEVTTADKSVNNLFSTEENNPNSQNIEDLEEEIERPCKKRKRMDNMNDASQLSAAIALATDVLSKPEKQETVTEAFGKYIVKQLDRITDERKRDQIMCDITNLINSKMYS